MPRIYATRAHLIDYAAGFPEYTVPEEPAASAMLARASAQVERLVTQPYDTDAVTLLPTDTDVAAALRDATCALVLRHQAAATDRYSSVSIADVTLTERPGSSSSAPLDPDPILHLQAAGLVSAWTASRR